MTQGQDQENAETQVLLLEAHPAVLALPVVPRLVAMAVPFKSARAKATVVLVVLCR